MHAELNKKVLRTLISAESYANKNKIYFNKKKNSYSKMAAISMYRSYCMVTYNGKVVTQQFKLGRHAMRQIACLGYLVGLRKSSF